MMSAYTLNLQPGREPVTVQVDQGDKGYDINFEIYDDNEAVNLTGATVLVSLKKPDKTTYVGIAAVTNAASGLVAVTLDAAGQMTAAAGEGVMELIVVRSGGQNATGNVRWIVEEGTSGTTSGDSADGFAELAQQVASDAASAQSAASDAEDAKEDAEAAQAAAEAAAARAEAIVIGNIRDTIFPVGSIVQYTSASIDPNSLIGGTWERIQGKFLFAADSDHAIGTTGGEETVTLTTANMPTHRHYVLHGGSGSTATTYGNTLARYNRATGTDDEYYNLMGNSNDANQGRSSASGSGAAHNNMPPYLAVHIWRRTA